MARGIKRKIEDVYNIMSLYFDTQNYDEVGKQLNIPVSSVYTIVEKHKDEEQFKILRKKKEETFINRANNIIDKGTLLLEKRLDTALQSEEELEELLSRVQMLGKEEITTSEIKAIAKRINQLQLNNLSEVTTAIGTIYDKRALAKGDSTSNNSVTVTMSNDLKELSK